LDTEDKDREKDDTLVQKEGVAEGTEEFQRIFGREDGQEKARSWRQVRSSSSGKLYWYNTRTGATQWQLPTSSGPSSATSEDATKYCSPKTPLTGSTLSQVKDEWYLWIIITFIITILFKEPKTSGSYSNWINGVILMIRIYERECIKEIANNKFKELVEAQSRLDGWVRGGGNARRWPRRSWRGECWRITTLGRCQHQHKQSHQICTFLCEWLGTSDLVTEAVQANMLLTWNRAIRRTSWHAPSCISCATPPILAR